MDSLLENENEGADSALLPVSALGAVAIRVARELSERLGRLVLLEVADDDREGKTSEIPEFDFPAGSPIRYVLYDRAEVGAAMVQAVAAKAKTGGKVIAFEIAAPGAKRAPSWRLGVDVLLRVADEAECLAAAEVLLPMATPPQGLISVDADDVLALFEGADVVQTGIGTAAGAQAVDAAVAQALGTLPWKPEFLHGILLFLAGGDSLGMKEVNASMDAIMARASADCNIVFGAEVEPMLGDRVRITLLATCGKRKESHDASNWMMGMLEGKFEGDENE